MQHTGCRDAPPGGDRHRSVLTPLGGRLTGLVHHTYVIVDEIREPHVVLMDFKAMADLTTRRHLIEGL
jgi:hypothetical protein